MLSPKKVAQSLQDEDGNQVTYYAVWSEERDRFMLDIHWTDKMDSDFLKALIVSFIEDCNEVEQDLFELEDISETKSLH